VRVPALFAATLGLAIGGCATAPVAQIAAPGVEAAQPSEIESWTCTVRRDWNEHVWSTMDEVVPNPADPEFEDRRPPRRTRNFYIHGSPAPASAGRIAFMSVRFAPIDVLSPAPLAIASYEVEAKGPRIREGVLRFEAADGSRFDRDAASHSRWLDLFKSNWIEVKDAEALAILTTKDGWAVSNVVQGKVYGLGPIIVPHRADIDAQLAASWPALDALVAEAATKCSPNRIDWSSRMLETI
jgi:hypothetical protein